MILFEFPDNQRDKFEHLFQLLLVICNVDSMKCMFMSLAHFSKYFMYLY